MVAGLAGSGWHTLSSSLSWFEGVIMKFLYSVFAVIAIVGAAFMFRYDLDGLFMHDRWTGRVYQHFPADQQGYSVAGERYWLKRPGY